MHTRLFAVDLAFLVAVLTVTYTAAGAIIRRYRDTTNQKGSRHGR